MLLATKLLQAFCFGLVNTVKVPHIDLENNQLQNAVKSLCYFCWQVLEVIANHDIDDRHKNRIQYIGEVKCHTSPVVWQESFSFELVYEEPSHFVVDLDEPYDERPPEAQVIIYKQFDTCLARIIVLVVSQVYSQAKATNHIVKEAKYVPYVCDGHNDEKHDEKVALFHTAFGVAAQSLIVFIFFKLVHR